MSFLTGFLNLIGIAFSLSVASSILCIVLWITYSFLMLIDIFSGKRVLPWPLSMSSGFFKSSSQNTLRNAAVFFNMTGSTMSSIMDSPGRPSDRLTEKQHITMQLIVTSHMHIS